jgi:hypothetical protein
MAEGGSRSGAVLDQKVFLLGPPALGGRRHPAWHAPATGPGVFGVLGIAVFGSDGAFALATLAEQVLDLKAVLLGLCGTTGGAEKRQALQEMPTCRSAANRPKAE